MDLGGQGSRANDETLIVCRFVLFLLCADGVRVVVSLSYVAKRAYLCRDT